MRKKKLTFRLPRTEQNFHKFFFTPLDGRSNGSDSLFYDYDLVISDRIIKRTVSSLSPLYSGLVSDHEAEAIVKWISDADFCAEYDTIASTDEKESYFKPVTYWRGPIWINTNWYRSGAWWKELFLDSSTCNRYDHDERYPFPKSIASVTLRSRKDR